MSAKIKRVSVRLTEDEYNILLLLSKKAYQPTFSAFVRAILKKFLEEKKEIKL
jgi:predicted DNA-binding protein